MPTSCSECRNAAPAAAGFTLLEMLLVLLLLGLLIGVGVNVALRDDTVDADELALQLANELVLAQQEAVLGGQVIGLDLSRQPSPSAAYTLVGYRWLQRGAEGWGELDPALFGRSEALVLWPAADLVPLTIDGSGYQPEVQSPATTPPYQVEVLVLPTREVTPFTLQAGEVLLRVDGFGRAEVVDAAQR